MEDDDVEKEEDNDVEEDDVEEEGRLIPRPEPPLCASLRSRKACPDFTRATLYRNLQEKCHSPKPRRRLCASLRSRNACQDFTRATFDTDIYRKNAAA